MASVPRVEVRVAPSSIADLLGVPTGTQVLTRQQKQYIDRTPWSMQTTAYPMEFVERGATRLLMAEDIAEGTVAYLGQTLGLRQVGQRDTLLVRPSHEDEAMFFKLSDDGRVSVVTVIRTGYADEGDGPVPFRVTFTVFPADRNQLVINSGDVPAELPGPAEG